MSGPPAVPSRSLYARLLGIRRLALPTWQRVLLVEGAVLVGLVLTLAELASAWVMLVMPVLAAGMVKYNDVLAGLLAPRWPPD